MRRSLLKGKIPIDYLAMDTLLEAFLESPLLPKQVEKLNQVLAAARTRRERFNEEMPEEGKWEFINGEIIMHSPAKWRHIESSDFLLTLMNVHVARHGLGVVAHEKLLVSLTRNDYEPDVSFFRKEVAAAFTPEQMQFPAPDFIAEVLSPSTARTDRGIKFRDYAAHGVSEYWIIDPVAQTIEQHTLQGDDYRMVGVWKGDDLISSLAVSGFRVPARALFEREANVAALLALVGPPAA